MKNLNKEVLTEEISRLVVGLNQLTKKQLAIIILAVNKGYDTKPLLQNGLSFEAMYQILAGMDSGVDVSVYSNPRFTPPQMANIRQWLENNVDVRDLVEEGQSSRRLDILASARHMREEPFIQKYNKSEYSDNRLSLLYQGVFQGIDVSLYDNTEKITDELAELILESIKNGIEVERFVNTKYSPYQSRELLLAENEFLDSSVLANPELSALQMRQIRIGLAQDVDAAKYADPSISIADMKKRRLELSPTYRDPKMVIKMIEDSYEYAEMLSKKLNEDKIFVE